MRMATSALLISGLALTGCGGGLGALNPMNLFSSSESAEMLSPLEARTQTNDPRPLMDQITMLEVEQAPGGALVRVSGTAPTTGYYGVDLLEVNDGEPVDGILTFRFVAAPPPKNRPVTPGRTQDVVAAKFVGRQVLENVTEILVIAKFNALTAKR